MVASPVPGQAKFKMLITINTGTASHHSQTWRTHKKKPHWPVQPCTVRPWTSPCRWELQEYRLSTAQSAGREREANTCHWERGWSPLQARCSSHHTPASETPQELAHPPLQGPLLPSTHPGLNKQKKTRQKQCIMGCNWEEQVVVCTYNMPFICTGSRSQEPARWRSGTEGLSVTPTGAM